MKTKLLIIASLALVATSAHATIALNTLFGPLTTSSGGLIPDGTLWALVVSTDAGDNFAGGFGLGGAITSAESAGQSFSVGQVLTLGGLIGGDTIFAMGGFSGASQGNPGFTQDALNLTLNGALAAGKNTAFYYFPGSNFLPAGVNVVGAQVGGFNAGATVGGDFDGYNMVIPADGSTVNFGGVSSDIGGTIGSTQAFNLVAIPEPTTALLGAVGALGFLRRRRN